MKNRFAEPAKPEFSLDSESVTEECGVPCEIKWTEPNNHGADITRYQLKSTPVEVHPDGTSVPIGPEVIVEIEDGRLTQELDHLLPNTNYRIELTAVNEIGTSEPAQMLIKTSGRCFI